MYSNPHTDEVNRMNVEEHYIITSIVLPAMPAMLITIQWTHGLGMTYGSSDDGNRWTQRSSGSQRGRGEERGMSWKCQKHSKPWKMNQTSYAMEFVSECGMLNGNFIFHNVNRLNDVATFISVFLFISKMQADLVSNWQTKFNAKTINLK